MADLEKGDHVEWDSPQGKAEGTVEKKLTSPTDIKSHHVVASKDNPEYLIETDSHKEAAHKPDELKKTK